MARATTASQGRWSGLARRTQDSRRQQLFKNRGPDEPMHRDLPAITSKEYEQRIDRVRAQMLRNGVDLALFDEIESLTWLAGYGNSMNRWRCLIVPLAGDPIFLIRALDASPCRAVSWVTKVEIFRDWENPMDALRDVVISAGIPHRRIGLDFTSSAMNLNHFALLRQALPDSEFIDLGNLVWELRLTKSEAEIGFLRRAAAVADNALSHAAEICTPGLTQKELSAEMAMTFADLGADIGPPGPISAAKGDHFLHALPSSQPLAQGDVVHIELTPRYRGYSARLMRCISVGPVALSVKEICSKIAGLQDRQIEAMRPGAVAGEIDAILRHGLAALGLRDRDKNITGYTLGLYTNAATRTSDFTRTFHPGATWLIEPGQVFHMYVAAWGVSLSETVLITDSQAERLTRSPRTVFESST